MYTVYVYAYVYICRGAMKYACEKDLHLSLKYIEVHWSLPLIMMYWLVVWNIFYFSIIYGMSSFPLTNIFHYFSEGLNHQPVYMMGQNIKTWHNQQYDTKHEWDTPTWPNFKGTLRSTILYREKHIHHELFTFKYSGH